MSAQDSFADLLNGLQSPASNIALVTASDSNDLPVVSRAIIVGTAGTLKVTTKGGQTIVIPANCLAVGVPHPYRVTRIWSTGTTASEIMVAW